ncbi:MAG: K(+)-transporting ATPase subunit F [Synechococcaceae cyanobacterium SM2_3_1]|nr:K(+)-transporting ATPase subunit F [Synechococcaceae cyanobacterium SM2_3_1]
MQEKSFPTFPQPRWHRRLLSWGVGIIMADTLILAPAVCAQSGGSLSLGQSWALGLLGLLTLLLSIYLFVVIIQPERF